MSLKKHIQHLSQQVCTIPLQLLAEIKVLILRSPLLHPCTAAPLPLLTALLRSPHHTSAAAAAPSAPTKAQDLEQRLRGRGRRLSSMRLLCLF